MHLSRILYAAEAPYSMWAIPRQTCSFPLVLLVSTAAAKSLAITGLGFRKQEATNCKPSICRSVQFLLRKKNASQESLDFLKKKSLKIMLLVSVRQYSFECLYVSFYLQGTLHVPKRYLQHLAVISGLTRTYSQTTGVN